MDRKNGRSEATKPTVIRRTRFRDNQTDTMEQPTDAQRKKRWATSIKQGDQIVISGPCELLVRRIDFKEAELVFILDQDVFCQKHFGDERKIKK